MVRMIDNTGRGAADAVDISTGVYGAVAGARNEEFALEILIIDGF